MSGPTASDDLSYEIYEDAIFKLSPSQGVLANDTDPDDSKLAALVNGLPRNPLFDFKTNGSFVYDARYHGALWLDSDVLAPSDGDDPDLPNGFDSLAAGATVYDEFTYLASDGQETDEGRVRIKILGVNDAPVADHDAATFQQGSDTFISIDVLDGDTDVDVWPAPDLLSIVGLSDIADDTGPKGGTDIDASDGLMITTAEGGTVTLANGELEYVAADGFFGIDTFEYIVDDGNGGTDTGTVRVTVLPGNVGPDAVDDSYQIGESAGQTTFGDGDPTGEAPVLDNDTDADDAPLIAADLLETLGAALFLSDADGNPVDADGNALTYANRVAGGGILADFDSDGTFEYDPNGAFGSLGDGESAYVSFRYTAYDGHGASDTATVTIEVQGENDAPTGQSPASVSVYEAGLATGSAHDPGGTGIPVEQSIDFTISDPDTSDTPFVASANDATMTKAELTAELTGTYGTLSYVDDDTWKYMLTSNANHGAGQVTDTFTMYAADGNGAFSSAMTVTVEIVDDVNFLVSLPQDGTQDPAAPVGTLDALDDKSVAFGSGNETGDTFTLIPGADGQTLDIVGIPDQFQLADGRWVTSTVVQDNAGDVIVQGSTPDGDDADSDPDLFYTLTIESDPDEDAATLLGKYTLELHQDPPNVVNDLDFSALKAGGPAEAPVVENIGFNGGIMTAPGAVTHATLATSFFDPGAGSSSDDINPNSAGGIGIGNGNVERGEILKIDVTGSSGTVTGLEFDVVGVGGGIGAGDILWQAVKGGAVVASGETFVDLSGKNGTITLEADPSAAFDFLYIALDPADFDSNDKMRINRIATVEEVANEDIELGFRLNSDDGDGDEAPDQSPGYVEFEVTIEGEGTGTPIQPDIIDLL